MNKKLAAYGAAGAVMRKELGFSTRFDPDKMCENAWNWHLTRLQAQ
jgi:UDP-glucose 4-epimerase